MSWTLQRPLAGQQTAPSRLWVAKLYYLIFFTAIGAIAPFFNVYLGAQGLSGTEIGLIGSLPPIMALLANPFWGAVAARGVLRQFGHILVAVGARDETVEGGRLR